LRIIVARGHKHNDAPHPIRLLRARREGPPGGRATEQRDEFATFQLIEWHSAPASQGQIAGYRIDHSQSADILNLVNRWPVPPKHHQG
jgi:hypothetical protein